MDQGIVVAFDTQKGFGFIRSRAYRDDVFVHASTLNGHSLRVGQRVTFTAESNDRGPRAIHVEPGRHGISPSHAAILGLAIVLIAVTIGLHQSGLGWLGAWLIGVNIATWPVYAWDKHQATRHERRVPELILLGLALIGGSPAAIVAMIALHHKTRKPAFLIPFAGVLLVQAVVISRVISKM